MAMAVPLSGEKLPTDTMNGTSRSGIGRRRGAGRSKKSPWTSAVVFAAAFVVTLLATALFGYVRFFSSAPTTPRVEGGTKGELRKHRVEGAGKGDGIDMEMSKEFRKWGGIIRGDLHLVQVDTYGMSVDKSKSGAKYRGVKGSFCKLDWDKYKKDPPSLPMFKFLVSASECDNPKYLVTVDLATAVKKSREFDKTREGHNDDLHTIPPSGFVFHESRVGSTLVANTLTAMDPEGHRVYSESDPINSALKACETCGKEANAELFQDVVYMMGRSNSPLEKKMFFKVSSIGSKRIDVMQRAFPTVPWIFVYRDPVQTMMSHLDPSKLKKMKVRGGAPKAVCLRAKKHPPEDLIQLVSDYGEDVDELSNEEFCAAHLATLCDSALKGIRKSDGKGVAVDYDGLIDTLVEKIYPEHFGLDVDEAAAQRIHDVAKTYSKSKGEAKDWVEDSRTKDIRSTPEIRDASETFLSKSYSKLKKYNIK